MKRKDEPVIDLDLPTYVINALQEAGFKKVSDITSITQEEFFRRSVGIGVVGFKKIEAMLKERNIQFVGQPWWYGRFDFPTRVQTVLKLNWIDSLEELLHTHPCYLSSNGRRIGIKSILAIRDALAKRGIEWWPGLDLKEVFSSHKEWIKKQKE
jgi:hypothetical protein